MLENLTLLNQQFPILFLLAVGYMAARLAYMGRMGTARGIDTAFRATVFAMLAQAMLAGLAMADLPPPAAYALAGVAVIAAALIWRRWAWHWLRDGLRRAGLMDHDGHRTVWDMMLGRDLPPPTQVQVRFKSGRAVACDELWRFADAPMGPCLFGEDGSVALYVTQVKPSGEDTWYPETPLDAHWGAMMTFIPADEISSVLIRRAP